MLNSLVRVSRRVRWLVYHRTTDYPTPGTLCTRGNAEPLTVTRDDGPPANPHSAGNTAATPHADKQPRDPLHCTCDVRAGYPNRSWIRRNERTNERTNEADKADALHSHLHHRSPPSHQQCGHSTADNSSSFTGSAR
ncbi:hypothetical protein ECG_06031 [Echinococcus granulosus]|nr:hypothetical protein ECG_06031 [Echinococcus granulosus]